MSLYESELKFLKFVRACRLGDLHEIKECIEAGVDVNVQDILGVNLERRPIISRIFNSHIYWSFPITEKTRVC